MIKIILKFIFAFSLVGWLVKKGTLNFALALQLQHNVPLVIFSFSLMIIPFITTTFRWKWLLEIKTQTTLPYVKLLGLTWLGQFFSTILPGGVTGDIIKVMYATKLHASLSKGYLLISAFADRIFGLIGLLLIQGTVSTMYFKQLSSLSPKLEILLYFNFSLFVGSLLFIATLFLKKQWQQKIITQTQNIPKVGQQLSHALEHFWLIGQHKTVFFKCLSLTVGTHLIQIFSFYILIQPFISHPLPLQYALSFIPLGFISTMIPISPLGLGVGHAMFQELFSYFQIMNGASLFNLFFLFQLVVNLLGGIPYIFYKD